MSVICLTEIFARLSHCAASHRLGLQCRVRFRFPCHQEKSYVTASGFLRSRRSIAPGHGSWAWLEFRCLKCRLGARGNECLAFLLFSPLVRFRFLLDKDPVSCLWELSRGCPGALSAEVLLPFKRGPGTILMKTGHKRQSFAGLKNRETPAQRKEYKKTKKAKMGQRPGQVHPVHW